ncbi:hypothetical protein ACOMHN_043532 [Nucella lapillus]
MTTREHSLRQEWEHRAHTSLPDNWHYQTPMTLFPHGTPFMPGGSEDMGPLPLVGNLTSFNINEDDMDCPGLGSHHLPATIRAVCGDEDPTTSRSFSQSPYNVCMNFSEGLYEISDEVRGGKVRAMSVDEVPAAHWDDDDDSNNNVVFLLPAPPTVEADNRGRRKSLNSTFSADSQGNRDTLPRTVQTLPTSKRRRRASLDSGVVGGRRVMEETGGMKGSERRAVAEPGTPMEGLTPAGGLTPYEGLTPVASFSSLEQLLADSQYIIGKLQPRQFRKKTEHMSQQKIPFYSCSSSSFTAPHPLSLLLILFHCSSSSFTAPHPLSLLLILFHCSSSSFTAPHPLSLLLILFHCSSSSFTAPHPLSLLLILFHCSSSSFTAPRPLSLLLILFHCSSSSFTAPHPLSLLLILFHCSSSSFTAPHPLSLVLILFHCSSSSFTAPHPLSLVLILFHCSSLSLVLILFHCSSSSFTASHPLSLLLFLFHCSSSSFSSSSFTAPLFHCSSSSFTAPLFHCSSSSFTAPHPLSLLLILFHCSSSSFTAPHPFSRLLILFHCSSSSFTAPHPLSLLLILFHCSSSSFTAPHPLSLVLILFHCSSSSFTAPHPLSLLLILFHCSSSSFTAPHPLLYCWSSFRLLVKICFRLLFFLFLALCAERVNQMTRTYNDIEAVAGLLEEKERDLELAARIGQTLLSKNKELSGRKELLEEQLTLASETIKQLKHELCKKVQQLEVYDQDLEESQTTQDDALGAGGGELAFSPGVVEKLQKKVGSLEEENISLRMETAQLLSDTETYEEKEKKLVKKSLRQYAELSEKVEVLTEELQMKKKENSNQKDDINSLVTQLNKVCHRIGQLTEENADLLDKLQAAQESQTQLARELSVQKDKYDELFEFLEKTQEQLRHRHPTPSPPPSSADGGISTESLASELQHSLSLEPSQEEEKEKPTSSLRRSDSWRIFETARAANRAALKARTSSDHIPSSASSCWDVDSLTASIPNSDTESFSDGYNADMDSVCGSTPVEFGRPGIPGSNDLQTALQRLALRQGHHEDDINRATPELRSGMMSPLRIPGTPDTVSSGTSGYSYLGCSNNAQSSSSSANYKMSSKLRIVKPMEGSVTLQQWQRLAQPHLGGLFEQRDGVKVKGERRLDLDQEAYTLSDFEDGEEGVEYACSLTESSRDGLWSPPAITSGNLHASASHPNLPTYLSSSPRSSSSSPKPMASSTPHSQLQSTRQTNSSGARPNNSYTMSLGLAAVLQGRDSSLARALMRTSAPSPRTVVSSSGRDSIAVMPADSVASVSGGAAAASGGRGCHQDASSSTDSGGGLFGKLISSGYSLLWNKSESAAPTVPPSPHSPDCVPGVEGQPATASQVFPRGGSGVLGAISTLRKNGIL